MAACKYCSFLKGNCNAFFGFAMFRKHVFKLSNGHLPANLSNSSTLRNFFFCCFWGVRVLAKRAIFGNMQDSADSPPFAKPFTEDSPDSPTFAKPFTEYSLDSPTFAKPFTEDSPDSLKVSLASITRVWRIQRVWRM